MTRRSLSKTENLGHRLLRIDPKEPEDESVDVEASPDGVHSGRGSQNERRLIEGSVFVEKGES